MTSSVKILLGILGSSVAAVGGYEVYTLSTNQKDLFGIYPSRKRKEITEELKKVGSRCTVEFEIPGTTTNTNDLSKMPVDDLESFVQTLKKFNSPNCNNVEVPPKTVLFRKGNDSSWETTLTVDVPETRKDIEKRIKALEGKCTIGFNEGEKEENTITHIPDNEIEDFFNAFREAEGGMCKDSTNATAVFKKNDSQK